MAAAVAPAVSGLHTSLPETGQPVWNNLSNPSTSGEGESVGKGVRFLNETEANEHPPPQSEEWKKVYLQAFATQNTQKLEWKSMSDKHLKKSPAEKFNDAGRPKKGVTVTIDDFSTTSDVLKAYSKWCENRTKLQKINTTIRSLNAQNQRPEHWGLVKEDEMLMPQLENEDDFEECLDKDPGILTLLGPYFSLGFALQLYGTARSIDIDWTSGHPDFDAFEKEFYTNNDNIDSLGLDEKFGLAEKYRHEETIKEKGRKATKVWVNSTGSQVAWLDIAGRILDPEDDEDEGMEGDKPLLDDEEQRRGVNSDGILTIPSAVKDIWNSLGGNGGLLQNFLLQNQPNSDPSLIAPIIRANEELVEYAKKNGEKKRSNIYTLNTTTLQMLGTLAQDSMKIFNSRLENSNDGALLQAHKKMVEYITEEVESRGWPESFIAALVPPVESIKLVENIVDDEMGDVGDSVKGPVEETIEEPVEEPELERMDEVLEPLLASILGQSGALSNFLHGVVAGYRDPGAERRTARAFDSIAEVCQKEGWQTPTKYDPNIGRLLESIEKMNEIRAKFDESGDIKDKLDVFAHTRIIGEEYADTPWPWAVEVIIGDLCTFDGQPRHRTRNSTQEPDVSQTQEKSHQKQKHGGPIPETSKLTNIHQSIRRDFRQRAGSTDPGMQFQTSKKHHYREVKAVKRGYVEGEEITTGARPGEVVEVVDGMKIHKVIVHFRTLCEEGKTATGKRYTGKYQLLLKWQHPDFTKPTYELIAASQYKTARESFVQMGGRELKLGRLDDLGSLSHVDIRPAGIAFVQRSTEEAYLIRPTTIVLIPQVKGGTWFNATTLRKKFGERHIKTMMEIYLEKSGQLEQKGPVSKKALKASVAAENARRAMLDLDLLPNATDTAKTKKRLAREIQARIDSQSTAKTKKRLAREYQARIDSQRYSTAKTKKRLAREYQATIDSQRYSTAKTKKRLAREYQARMDSRRYSPNEYTDDDEEEDGGTDENEELESSSDETEDSQASVTDTEDEEFLVEDFEIHRPRRSAKSMQETFEEVRRMAERTRAQGRRTR